MLIHRDWDVLSNSCKFAWDVANRNKTKNQPFFVLLSMRRDPTNLLYTIYYILYSIAMMMMMLMATAMMMMMAMMTMMMMMMMNVDCDWEHEPFEE